MRMLQTQALFFGVATAGQPGLLRLDDGPGVQILPRAPLVISTNRTIGYLSRHCAGQHCAGIGLRVTAAFFSGPALDLFRQRLSRLYRALRNWSRWPMRR